MLGMLMAMSAEEVIAAFAAAWNAASDAERLRLLTACRLPDVVFAAPQGQVAGIDALSASMILAAPRATGWRSRRTRGSGMTVPGMSSGHRLVLLRMR